MKTTDTQFNAWLNESLTPQPLNNSVNSRVLVQDAIEFNGPERIPYSLINPVRSDFFEVASLVWRDRAINSQSPNKNQHQPFYYDEWHIKRERTVGLFDRVIESPLANLHNVDDYVFPQIPDPVLAKQHKAIIYKAFQAGKFIVGYDAVNLFDRAVALAGIENTLLGPYKDNTRFTQLLDNLTELTLIQIEEYGRAGNVQAFMTWQDFGTQNNLLISIEDFRKNYRHRIQKMIDLTHAFNMHFIWHCCGAIIDLIPEMIEMGVDVVQLDQARLLGYQNLSTRFGGKICFWNTLDTLWVTQKQRNEAEIFDEVTLMHKSLSGFNGGLMFRHYPQYQDIGIPDEVQQLTAEAFIKGIYT